MARVIVVGAGVVGLSCAIRLLEAGQRVDIVARDLPLETTSVVAAAMCFPYLAEPVDLVQRWSDRTTAVLDELADADPEAGVRRVAGTIVAADATTERSLPVADMPTYLRWLTARVGALGGTLTRINLSALPTHADLVVNCTGLGARHLAGDPSVTPVAGQVVVVEQFGLERWWLDPAGPTYVIPREHEVVVGGTEQRGEWSRTPSPDTAAAIIERASALVPAVRRARVLRHKVGLRPARPTVRLERVDGVVHCYGHGGSGVTLSWGCAEDVVRLVTEA
jgi:D-amino-acid oxidase